MVTVALKIVVLGDSGVGKSNILSFINSSREAVDGTTKSFIAAPRATIGVEFNTACIMMDDGTRVQAQIWDTAGQERYHSITSAHYRKASGALLIYDVTNIASFDHCIDYWHKELVTKSEDSSLLSPCVALIGNKCDLVESSSSSVSVDDHLEATRKLNLRFSGRTSAKTGAGIVECFESLLIGIVEFHRQNGSLSKFIVTVPDEVQTLPMSSSSCC